MTDQQRQECRETYNRLRQAAIQPGESLSFARLIYSPKREKLVVKWDRLEKWRAA